MNLLQLTALSVPDTQSLAKPVLVNITTAALRFANPIPAVSANGTVSSPFGTQVTVGTGTVTKTYMVADTVQEISLQEDPTTANLFGSPSLVVTGITAATTQTQGQGTLTGYINVVATVANTNDTVTLPVGPAAGGQAVVIVINNGAHTLQVFPPTGAHIDGGATNASTTIPVGSKKHFYYVPVASGSVTQIYTALPSTY